MDSIKKFWPTSQSKRNSQPKDKSWLKSLRVNSPMSFITKFLRLKLKLTPITFKWWRRLKPRTQSLTQAPSCHFLCSKLLPKMINFYKSRKTLNGPPNAHIGTSLHQLHQSVWFSKTIKTRKFSKNSYQKATKETPLITIPTVVLFMDWDCFIQELQINKSLTTSLEFWPTQLTVKMKLLCTEPVLVSVWLHLPQEMKQLEKDSKISWTAVLLSWVKPQL